MITEKKIRALLESGDYVVAKRRVKLTTGDIVRMLREKNELTQLQLAEATYRAKLIGHFKNDVSFRLKQSMQNL